MEDYKKAFEYLKSQSSNFNEISEERVLKHVIKESKSKRFVYLIRWGQNRFCWGTMAGNCSRLRKTSIFNSKLTGKYDRRLDYLMLKEIHKNDFTVHLFEFTNDEKYYEQYLKDQFNQRHCYRGFTGIDRNEISKEIIKEFRNSNHFKTVDKDKVLLFEQYIKDIYFNESRCQLTINNKRRTWRWGDSLEPGFISKKLGLAELEEGIEAVLKVQF